MLSTCAVFVWQSRHRGVAQFGRAPRSGRGGRGFKSRHLDQRDAGPNFALGSALFISSAQLCVAQLCSAHRTRGLIWLKVPMRDAGSKVALDSALFLCLFSDEGAAYAYFCRTEMHEVHKKGRKAAFLFIGPVGKYLTTALLYDTI